MNDPVGGATGTTAWAARLGIFARTFRRSAATEVAQAVRDAGYPLAHWNFAAIGLPTLAVDISESEFIATRTAFDEAGIAIPSVSATCNITHPDPEAMSAGIRAACRLIELGPLLGATVVTICTGTRDPVDMWRCHPDNSSAASWSAMRRSLDTLLVAADNAGVVIGVEPESGNVVSDAEAAARLLDELGSNAPVGIVLDPANLLTAATVHRQDEIIAHALHLLGDRVVGVQLKDVVVSGYSAAGVGLIDYPRLLAQLDSLGAVPMIVQDAAEDDATRVRLDLLGWYGSR